MINISVTKSVLQVKTDKLTEVGKCRVMEIDVERSKVMKISKTSIPSTDYDKKITGEC